MYSSQCSEMFLSETSYNFKIPCNGYFFFFFFNKMAVTLSSTASKWNIICSDYFHGFPGFMKLTCSCYRLHQRKENYSLWLGDWHDYSGLTPMFSFSCNYNECELSMSRLEAGLPQGIPRAETAFSSHSNESYTTRTVCSRINTNMELFGGF